MEGGNLSIAFNRTVDAGPTAAERAAELGMSMDAYGAYLAINNFTPGNILAVNVAFLLLYYIEPYIAGFVAETAEDGVAKDVAVDLATGGGSLAVFAAFCFNASVLVASTLTRWYYGF